MADDAATTVAAAGTSIDLKFSENLAAVANNQAEFDQFTVKVNGVANAVTATALTNDVLTLTLTNKVGAGDVVTVEYAQAMAVEVRSQMRMQQMKIFCRTSRRH